MTAAAAAAACAEQAFVRACTLDVAVRKPGNVSFDSPGHRMTAAMFIDSAQAAAPALCQPGARVGERIEAAVRATWSVVDCNTNLGIVLLCAPLAAAAERVAQRHGEGADPDSWRAAIEAVLGELDLDDAAAAFRAISRANPGGLGDAPQQDVRAAPSVDLRAAMTLAAPRDRIAAQYANGFSDVFDTGLPALADVSDALRAWPPQAAPSPALAGAVQRCGLDWLSAFPDSHIVRKRGDALAHTVLRHAQVLRAAPMLDARHWQAWDEQLKADSINPGTTADLTVASVMLAALIGAR